MQSLLPTTNNTHYLYIALTILFGVLSVGLTLDDRIQRPIQISTTASENIEFVMKGKMTARNTGEALKGTDIFVFTLHEEDTLATTRSKADGTYKVNFTLSKEALYPTSVTYKPWENQERNWNDRGGRFRIETRKEGFAKATEAVVNDSTVLVKNIQIKKPNPEIAISSLNELKKIGKEADYPLDANYKLTSDIDASATAQWNGGKGFDPIGHDEEKDKAGDERPFTGTFDGQGHRITGLTIDQPDGEVIGLFSRIKSGTVKNLILREVSITGNTLVGGLAGASASLTTIKNCTVTGNVSGFIRVGLLTGESVMTKISGAMTSGAIAIPKEGRPHYGRHWVIGIHYFMGGIAGKIAGTKIQNTHADVDFDDKKRGYSQIGGLAGNMNISEIIQSHAAGDLKLGGKSSFGGLIGAGRGLIYASHATGDIHVYGTDDVTPIGGLVGSFTGGKIKESYATGSIRFVGDSGGLDIGGLVGVNTGTIKSSYALVDISGQKSQTGGLVGDNSGEVQSSFAAGKISSNESSAIGGLIGGKARSIKKVSTSYWNATVSSLSNAFGKTTDGQLKSNGLTTEQMTGKNAKKNMPRLDFEEIWKVVPGDYPTLQRETEPKK